MLWDFSEPGEESVWRHDHYDIEPGITEAAEDLGYNIFGVKRYGSAASPLDPIERHITNYLVFDGDLEAAGTYSGIKAEYTPLSLTVEKALEEEMDSFLKTGTVFQGIGSEELNEQTALLANIPERKDYDAELAEEVIEMADAKMGLEVPEPEITDLKEEESELFRYIYDL